MSEHELLKTEDVAKLFKVKSITVTRNFIPKRT